MINFIDSEEAMEACREIVKHSGKAMYSLCDEADFNNVNVARRARRVKRQLVQIASVVAGYELTKLSFLDQLKKFS